ncbi:MAG: pyridoxamine 5'-phosphate oxidase family protein [Clostridiales bacterium]|nr:pyridoxamine 5'-phosphate oxidase family protein [Clostridiales bacterium]
MFAPMRRHAQQLSPEECIRILEEATSGVLALAGGEAYPYAVPLSYVYKDGKLYFHCAPVGHKLDAIKKNPKVSFCVIAEDNVKPQEYTTYYRSVILFGTARLLQEEAEKRAALSLLAARFTPDDPAGRQQEIDKLYHRTTIVEIAIDHITGKAARELLHSRTDNVESGQIDAD